jgi:hypothetical protein
MKLCKYVMPPYPFQWRNSLLSPISNIRITASQISEAKFNIVWMPLPSSSKKFSIILILFATTGIELADHHWIFPPIRKITSFFKPFCHIFKYYYWNKQKFPLNYYYFFCYLKVAYNWLKCEDSNVENLLTIIFNETYGRIKVKSYIA